MMCVWSATKNFASPIAAMPQMTFQHAGDQQQDPRKHPPAGDSFLDTGHDKLLCPFARRLIKGAVEQAGMIVIAEAKDGASRPPTRYNPFCCAHSGAGRGRRSSSRGRRCLLPAVDHAGGTGTQLVDEPAERASRTGASRRSAGSTWPARVTIAHDALLPIRSAGRRDYRAAPPSDRHRSHRNWRQQALDLSAHGRPRRGVIFRRGVLHTFSE
jgi:hypothetical protein